MRQVDISLWNIYQIVKPKNIICRVLHTLAIVTLPKCSQLEVWCREWLTFSGGWSQFFELFFRTPSFSSGLIVIPILGRWIFQVRIDYNLFRPQPRLSFVWLPDVHPWSGPHLLYDQDQHCPSQPHLWSGQSQIMKHFFRCKQLKVLEKNPLCSVIMFTKLRKSGCVYQE